MSVVLLLLLGVTATFALSGLFDDPEPATEPAADEDFSEICCSEFEDCAEIDEIIMGDDGDDYFCGCSSSGPAATIDGGGGNDTLDANFSNNIVLRGGDGDDVLISRGTSYQGTNYFIDMDGGAGDDRLIQQVDLFSIWFRSDGGELDNYGSLMTGGAGADQFEIAMIEREPLYPMTEDMNLIDAATIRDFEAGIDTIIVDLSGLSGHVAESAYMIERNISDGTDTEIWIRMIAVSPDISVPYCDILITVSNTSGLSWDNVAFVGGGAPTLTGMA